MIVFDLAKFLLFIFFFVFLPGRLVIWFTRMKLSSFETVLVSTVLGIPLLTFLVWVFSYLRLDVLVFPLLLLGDFFLIWKLKWRPEKIEFKKTSYLPLVVVLTGALFQGILMFKSGTTFQGGIAFWGVHGYDGIWHAALIQELVNHFPPQNPGFAGEALKNYHFLTDLFMAQIHKITQVPILDLYFRFCPIFFTLLLNSLIYVFAKRWSGKQSVALWAVFFASIAGSFGFIPPLFGKGSNNWETAFWGIQPTTAFLNPPFGVSLILLMAGLILFDQYLEEKSSRLILILAFVFGLLIGFKVYAGIIILVVLGILGALEIFKKKFDLLLLFFLSLILALIIYLPTSSGSGNFLVFKPWWFIKTMIEAPDRLNWPSLELRRQIYTTYNDWIHLFLLQVLAFFIFLFGNLGTRFVGFFSIIKRSIRNQPLDRFLLLLLVIAFLPPIFFIQKAVPWNSIQFFYYFTFLFSFFAAEAMILIISNFKFQILKIIFSVFVITFALPSTLKTIYWFNALVPTTLLDKKEVEALFFLKEKSKPQDVLLTYPFNSYIQKRFKEPPVPMTYYNSPYVSFFSGRRVFLEDLNAATILGYDIQSRLDKEEKFFQTQDSSWARIFLRDQKIRFVYLVDDQAIAAKPGEIGLKKIFDNQKVRIYEVGDTI